MNKKNTKQTTNESNSATSRNRKSQQSIDIQNDLQSYDMNNQETVKDLLCAKRIRSRSLTMITKKKDISSKSNYIINELTLENDLKEQKLERYEKETNIILNNKRCNIII